MRRTEVIEWERSRENWARALRSAHAAALEIDPRMGAWAGQVAPFHKLSEHDISMMADFLAALEAGRVPRGGYAAPRPRVGRPEDGAVLDGFVRGY